MVDPLSITCPLCGAPPKCSCMDCKILPTASTVCWEVPPHKERTGEEPDKTTT